jgi:hypothetical protein
LEKILISLLILFLVGCVTSAPTKEYALARTSLLSAKDVGGARYAPAYWHQAEETYREGVLLFDQEKFSAAQQKFEQARFYSEKAENVARIEKAKSGEAVP